MDKNLNDNFDEFDELDRDLEFECMSVTDAVEMYKPHAKYFSLTAFYSKFDHAHPYGMYGITDDNYNKALSELDKNAYNWAKSSYDELTEKEKELFPPFDELYFDICAEFDEFAAGRKITPGGYGLDGYFNAAFRSGKTKYNYACLSEIYRIVGNAGKCRDILKNTIKNAEPCPLTRELEEYDCYRALLKHLKKVDVTFFIPCAAWAALSRVFYFEINEATEWWLENYYSIWDAFELLFGVEPPLKHFALHDENGETLFWRADDVDFQNGIDPDTL